MLDYTTMLATVGERAGTADTHEARRATQGVVRAVARVTRKSFRDQLAERLPGQLRDFVEVTVTALPTDAAGLVRAVSAEVGCSPERARYYAQAVLSVLAEAEPGLGDNLTGHVRGVEDLLAPVGAGVAPSGSAAPTPGTPELLDQERLRRELAALPGWEGDQHRLRRTVGLPTERVRPLLDAVRRVEVELHHHARVEQNRDAVTFELWTHALDCVTDLDLVLARRISDAVQEVGSGG